MTLWRASTHAFTLLVMVSALLSASRVHVANVLAAGACATPLSVLATIPTGAHPIDIGVDSTEGRIYAANLGDKSVAVIDAKSLQVTETWNLGGEPTALAVGSRPSQVYVAQRDGARSALGVFRPDTGDLVRTDVLDMRIADLHLSPGSSLVYAVGWVEQGKAGGESSNGAIVALDGHGGRIEALRFFGGLFHRFREIVAAPPGQVYVSWTARYGRGGLSAFDAITLDGRGDLMPHGDNTFTGISVDTSGRRLMLATTWQWVQIVDLDLPLQRPTGPTEGKRLLSQIDAGRPSRMVYDARTGILYVTRWPLGDDDVSGRELIVADTWTALVIGTVPIGAGAHAVALDPTTHRVFVTNRGDGTVTVVQGIRPPSTAVRADCTG
jgi:YVTN family beta-propeller protein